MGGTKSQFDLILNTNNITTRRSIFFPKYSLLVVNKLVCNIVTSIFQNRVSVLFATKSTQTVNGKCRFRDVDKARNVLPPLSYPTRRAVSGVANPTVPSSAFRDETPSSTDYRLTSFRRLGGCKFFIPEGAFRLTENLTCHDTPKITSVGVRYL